MTAIADPRAPRVAVRRKGPNLEKWGWIYMRVSGVLLVVLIFGHLFVNLLVGEGIHGIDFAFVAGKFASPFWQWWDVIMLWLAAGFLIVLGTLVVFTFDPCLGFDPSTASDTMIEICS